MPNRTFDIRTLVLFLIGILFSFNAVAQKLPNTLTIKGVVVDEPTNEPLPFANISVLGDEHFITGAATDYEGHFLIENVPNQPFKIKVEFVGYFNRYLNFPEVLEGNRLYLKILMKEEDIGVPVETPSPWIIPLIDFRSTASGQIIYGRDLERSVGRQ